MPHVVQYDSLGDEKMYRQVKAAVGDEPHGLQLHLVVGLPNGGLRHIEVWDSAVEQEEFARDHVAPAVASVLRSVGVESPQTLVPRETFELIDLHVARRS